jgi:hypothetical protein
MTEEIKNEELEIFYYYDSKGKKYFTPNLLFAQVRANYYNTIKVFVEKN